MPRLKVGDIVLCRIASSVIVSPYLAYDETKSFAIIGTDSAGYYLYVPHYMSLQDSRVADLWACSSLGFDSKYLGEQYVHIDENLIASVEREMSGMRCKVCNEIYEYAEPNRGDGTLVCFSCRQNPYH